MGSATRHGPCISRTLYSFWGGKDAFQHYCDIHTGHRPALPWERLVPPPFLDDWKAFLKALQRGVVPQPILTKLSIVAYV